jgi:transglutaminase/protease-like cytokinesis protein 3
VVTGYTRQSGFTDYIPHAWCATRVDSAWYIFDPTWGSGYVANGKFISRINNFYCMADPAVIIKSHMPFDYLWQFLNYPVSNQAFYDGKTAQNKSTAFFNYADSLISYEKQDTAARLHAAASRIERNGIKNSLIFDRLQHIRLELEYYRVRTENQKQQANIDRYNLSVVYYNDGINYMNDFIQYRNKQFTPEKPDQAIRAMLDTVAGKIDQAAEKLSGLTMTDANAMMLVEKQQKAIAAIRNQLKEQQDWLALYFSKSKSKRKAMFYEKRTTVFGIPVN